MTVLKKLLLLAIVPLAFIACDDDDNNVTPAATAKFVVTIENVLPVTTYQASGPTGFMMPGESESVTFNAGKGSYLSFATMFVQSNDLFYAFNEKGLALYDDMGMPRTGDVSAEIELWDAGTEVNEEPGVGPNQAPRQGAANTGPDENGVVQLVNDGFTYPMNETVIRLTLAHDGGTGFTLTIENISGSSSLPSPLAPGVWVVHGMGTQLFTSGQMAPTGLEGVAEDGDNATLVSLLADGTGYTSPFAPGVWAVHEDGVQSLFTNGAADRGDGLEALAEDGDPSALNSSLMDAMGILSNGVFNTPVGAGAPGPLMPGNSYTFTFEAEEGNFLNFATMLVQTNDLFYAFGENGLALFVNGTPIQGDFTSQVMLWDAGTEVNEYPGAGNNQPVRGGGNSGPAENGNVMPVNDGFTYPSVAEGIKVNIEVM